MISTQSYQSLRSAAVSLARCTFVLIIAVVSLTPEITYADPSDKFLKAYMSVQAGDRLEDQGKLLEALRKYKVAAELLDDISRNSPDWQPHVLKYRMRKTSEGIARLTQELGPEAIEAAEVALPGTTTDEGDFPLPSGETDPSEPSLTIDPSNISPYDPTLGKSTGDVLNDATREIRNRIRQLETELNTARQRARRFEEERTQLAKQLQATDAELKEALRKLDQSQLSQTELKSEVENLKETLKSAITQSPAQEQLQEEISRLNQELDLVKAERDLAQDENIDLNTQISRQQAIAARINIEREAIIAERDAALAEVTRATESREESERLLAENAKLMQELESAEERIRKLQDNPESDELLALRDQVGDLREQLAMAQGQQESYQVANAELQSELNRVSAELAELQTADLDPAEQDRLVAENQILKQIIKREMQAQARRQQAKSLVLEELQRMEVESELLVEQLDLLGQPVMQLSAEELALLRSGDVTISESSDTTEPPLPVADETLPATTESSVTIAVSTVKDEQPESAGSQDPVELEAAVVKDDEQAEDVVQQPSVPEELQATAREAREFFDRGQYREAAELYNEILLQAPNNLYALSNLGVTQYRSGRLNSAEASFKKAIAIDPEDSFSMSTLGIVYYQQGRYDDAIDVLTKAIAIDPKNAIAHNYLGITASQKGWQEAAEKELQAAIAINPNYADAHFNLAVIYAVSQPPAQEMARKHYDMATQLGADPDPTLERLIQ